MSQNLCLRTRNFHDLADIIRRDRRDEHGAEAALASQARAAHMPAERYLSQIIESALKRQHRLAAENLALHLDHMASQVLPDTTPEEMEDALEAALSAARPRRSWHR